tara:strand:- start:435 stop:1142 length:708 start_codon:yes stop_codon:yes gene_type:complete
MVNYPLIANVDSEGNVTGLKQASSIEVSSVTTSSLSALELSAGGKVVALLDNIENAGIIEARVEDTLLVGTTTDSYNQSQCLDLFVLKDGWTIQPGKIVLNSTSGAHEVSGGMDVSGNLGISGNTVVTGSSTVSGSVGIGATPNNAAVLDVASTTKSFLPPRMTTTQRNAIATPPAGSVIYNTTTNLLNHYNGSAWLAVGAVAAGASETKAFYDGLGGTQTVTILNGLITSWVTS